MKLIELTVRVELEHGWMSLPEKKDATVFVNPEHILTMWKLDNGLTAVRLVQNTILQAKESMDTIRSRIEDRRPYMPGLWEE